MEELRKASRKARRVWERDREALHFELTDLEEIERALEDICRLSEGIAPEAEDTEEP